MALVRVGVRDERGQSRLPLLLMVGGGVVLVAALAYVLFGRGSGKSGDDAAALEVRCQFPACRASSDLRLGRGFEGESVAVDPTNHDHIVVTDANMAAGHCTWHTTFDRGKEWIDGTFQEPAGYTGCHINGAAGGHVPTGAGGVSFGSNGVIFATYASASRDQGTRESVLFAKSTDGGKSFSVSVAARPPGDDASFARPLMTVIPGGASGTGPDRILVSTWLCNQNGRFCPGALFFKSEDGGATWTQPVAVHDAALGVRSPSEPIVLADQSILVTYIADYDGGTADLLLAKSTDGGATWASTTIDRQPHIGDRYDPGKMAYDPRANAIYLVYSDQRTGQQQIIFRKSTDRGVTWSDPTGIAPDQQATSTGSSRTPSISVAPNGRIDIAYYRTPAANTDNVFWASSVDGGIVFQSKQVNDSPIRRFEYNRAIGTWYPPDVTSLDDGAWVAWSDSKNSQNQDENTQDIYLRRMVPAGSDIPP